jgi:hypothetical protein
LSLEQHGNFADINVLFGEVFGNTDSSVISSRNPFGNCVGVLEHATDSGISDPPVYMSINDNQAKNMPCTSIAIGLPGGDVKDLWIQDTIYLDNIRTVVDFVKLLQGFRLDDPSLGMSNDALEHL